MERALRPWIVLGALLSWALSVAAAPPPAMNNADVVRLVSLGLRPDVVIAVIRGAPRRAFDLSFPALSALSAAGVSEPVLQAMREDGPPPAGDAAAAPGLTIDIVPPACLVAERFPRLDACVTPAGDVLQAQVFFRASDRSSWYFVDMRPQGSCFTAVLPKPQRKAGSIRYYVRVVDAALGEKRTAEQTSVVASDEERCRKLGLVPGPTESTAAPVVGSDSFGATPVPPGFLPDGVNFAGTPSHGSP